METLLAVAQHKSQYRNKSDPSNQFTSPSRTFSSTCRSSFQFSPDPKPHTKPSKPITINPNPKKLSKSNSEDLSKSSPPFAGPAYSNSPPPSSLPIPKFSLRQKRSVSLDLPSDSRADVALRPVARSAPSSPTGGSGLGFSVEAAIATENLRRILRLDDE